jgi:hypothetical protein
MPWAMVGDIQTGHAGLLTHVKNDRLNQLFSRSEYVVSRWVSIGTIYLNSARMTQSW